MRRSTHVCRHLSRWCWTRAASAFLYSGPAINVMLAIFLTARVLGYDLGGARVIGSVVFAVVIGLIMAVIFRKDEEERTAAVMQLPEYRRRPRRNLAEDHPVFRMHDCVSRLQRLGQSQQTVIEKTDGTHAGGRSDPNFRDLSSSARRTAGGPEEGCQADAEPIGNRLGNGLYPDNYKWVAWVCHHAGILPAYAFWPCWQWSSVGSTGRS